MEGSEQTGLDLDRVAHAHIEAFPGLTLHPDLAVGQAEDHPAVGALPARRSTHDRRQHLRPGVVRVSGEVPVFAAARATVQWTCRGQHCKLSQPISRS